MRKSMVIVIFLVMMNATSGFLAASGVAEDTNMAPQPGGSQQVADVSDAAEDVNPGGGAGATLFGLFVSAGSIVKDIFVMATIGGPVMLSNAGMPSWLVAFIFAPMYLIVGADTLYVYTGRSV